MISIDNLSYGFNFSKLPTLVNKEIEDYLISKTEECLFELVEENKEDITKITERLLKGEMNRVISKINEEANVKRFDIILYRIIMPYEKFKIEYKDLETNKSYTEVFDNNYLTSNFCIEYLINSELERYDSNLIKSKIIFYKNSFSSIHLNQMIKKEKAKMGGI